MHLLLLASLQTVDEVLPLEREGGFMFMGDL
jgi:hypothetical protein